MRPYFDHLQKYFQAALERESHQAIDNHMCKFKGKLLMKQYKKNKPIKWEFKSWFSLGCKFGYLYDFDMYMGKKGSRELGLGESVAVSLCQKLKKIHIATNFLRTFCSSKIFDQTIRNGNLCN